MRLLVLSCSQRKRRINSPVEALSLYSGVFFQVLKKALVKPEIHKDLDVIILSAKYGLLLPTTLISHYDERMTKKRLAELQPLVFQDLRDFLCSKNYSDIFVNLGKDYLPLVPTMFEFSEASFGAGGSGLRCKQLKEWLYLPISS